jgi:acyl-coenzyme A synthetase/AMP-(fatty) acid ligase
MHPADIVFFWAKADPEQPALLQPGMAVTYGNLAQAIQAVSKRIDRLDLPRTDPVAVSIPHPTYALVVCLALMRAGFSVAPANPAAILFLRQHGITNLIYAGQGQILSGGRNIPFEPTWLRRDDNASVPWGSATGSRADESALIVLEPSRPDRLKTLVIPAAAISAQTRLLPVGGETTFERVLITSDLSSPYGFIQALKLLYAGRTACFAANDGDRIRLMTTFGIDVVSGTLRQVAGLLDHVEQNSKGQFEALKQIRVSAATFPPALIEGLQARLCSHVTTEYWLPETGLIATADYNRIGDIGNAVGFAMPGTAVEAVDQHDVPVASNQDGIIRCRTGALATIAGANGLKPAGDGKMWWYPGCYGRLDEQGVLRISREAGAGTNGK